MTGLDEVDVGVEEVEAGQEVAGRTVAVPESRLLADNALVLF